MPTGPPRLTVGAPAARPNNIEGLNSNTEEEIELLKTLLSYKIMIFLRYYFLISLIITPIISYFFINLNFNEILLVTVFVSALPPQIFFLRFLIFGKKSENISNNITEEETDLLKTTPMYKVQIFLVYYFIISLLTIPLISHLFLKLNYTELFFASLFFSVFLPSIFLLNFAIIRKRSNFQFKK